MEGRGERGGGGRTYRVKDGRQSTSSRQRSDHDSVHLVVDDHASLLVVDRVDGLVVPVVFVPVEILRLTTVA